MTLCCTLVNVWGVRYRSARAPSAAQVNGLTVNASSKSVGPFCFTSTEARWLIRDGDRGGGGRKCEGSTMDTARKRPERPWTAARTMEVLRRCPLAIAQGLVHCAIAVSTAVLGQSQGQCPLHCCWATTRSERSPTFAAQLHLPTHDLFWANLKVQLHFPPLDILIFWSRLDKKRDARRSLNSFQRTKLETDKLVYK